MKKETINHLIYFFAYFIFLTLINSLYSFSYWPLYIGGLVGLFMSNLDHLLHIFVFQPQELTSQRTVIYLKTNNTKKHSYFCMILGKKEKI